ncbi:MAG: peptidoglycan DD-metalloendopeptidase family protein [Candidatus Accumulibacter sp.]|jgi:lipoprotein NlpD|nr:peptidoglycan DD-metalloendopeptidase family protein [Accumulibacter sp.]
MKRNGFVSGIGRAALMILALGLAACASRAPAPVVDRAGQVPGRAAVADTYTVKAGDTLYSIAREHGLDFRELITLNGIENPDQIAVGRTLRIRRPQDRASSPETAVTAPVSADVVVARPIGDAPSAAKPPEPDGDRVKREPKAGKEPYSDQALAAAQGQPKPAETAAAKPETPPGDKSAEGASPAAASDGVHWIWPSNGKLIGTFSESGSKGVDIAGKDGDPVIAAGDGKVVYSGVGLRGYGKLVIVKHNASFLSAYAHNRNILVAEGQSVAKGQKIAEMGKTDADRVKLHFEIRLLGKPVDPLKYLPPR